jgi:hypothetical protein
MKMMYRVRSIFPLVMLSIVSAWFLCPASNLSTRAQVSTEQTIVVAATPPPYEIPGTYEIPSAYGAPAAFSQSRFSPLTNAYVLPSGEIYNSVIYELDVVHFRPPDNHWTLETEMGLPYRFNIAMECDIQHFDGDTQASTVSFEGRYAFADWDKIPLNPTVFAEYKIGMGDVLHDEGAPTPGKKFGPGGFDKSGPIPDGYEVRLLLSEEFFHRIEWALNGFFEQEIEGDRGREWGIAQSVVTPIYPLPTARTAPPPSDHKNVQANNVQPVPGTDVIAEELKAGVEFQFRSFSDKFGRGIPYNSFVIGPTVSWKATSRFRLDASPLFGVNHRSPILQLFVVASYLWGPGGPGKEAGGEAPASTRNR